MQLTFIRETVSKTGAIWRHYNTSEPIEYDYDWEEKKFKNKTNYIIISAVYASFSGPETYIFPADQEGNILNFTELEGSRRGTLDHNQIISEMGWNLNAPTNKSGS